MKSALGCRCALLLAVGCGGPNVGFDPPISSQPLSGQIDGQPWRLGTGEAAFVRGVSAVQYLLELYPVTFEPCVVFGAPSDAKIVTMVAPTKVGTYHLGFEMTATLHTPGADFECISTEGKLVLDSITATTITGGLRAACGSDNTVDGQFQATICP